MSRATLCRSGDRRGLTLVEVVAGLALLASLGVAMLSILTAHRQQARQAADRLQAADLADQLLAGWYSSGGGVPRNAAGVFSRGECQWTTRAIDQRMVDGYAIEIVRLQVAARARPGVPLVTINLLSRVPGQRPLVQP